MSASDLENTLYLDVPAGRVVIQLRPDLAPGHVARIKELARQKFYDGVVSMARASDPNSGDSQFFIMLADTPQLDGKYAIWGKVVSGMEYIDAIKKGDPNRNGAVDNPDHIVRMQIAADADKAKKS